MPVNTEKLVKQIVEVFGKSEYTEADYKPAGTEVSEYAEQGKNYCGMCMFRVDEHYCNHPVVLTDPKLEIDKDSGLKIINPEKGCCRYVKPGEKK